MDSRISYSTNSRKWSLFVYSLTVASLLGGLVYGFPALRYNLLEHEGSILSEQQLGLVYTAGSGAQLCAGFIIGLLRDTFGTRNAVQVSLVSAASGSLILAFCSANSVWQLSLSLVLMELGSGAQICVLPVAGLFENPGMVLGLLAGALNVSTLFFPLFFAISKDRIFGIGGYTIIIVIMAVIGYFLLPIGLSFHPEKSSRESVRRRFSIRFFNTDTLGSTIARNSRNHDDNDSDNDSRDCDDDVDDNVDNTNNNNVRDDIDEYNKDNDKNKESNRSSIFIDHSNSSTSRSSFASSATISTRASLHTTKDQLKSAEYLGILTWFAVSILPLQYYAGSIGFQLENKGDFDGKYASLFSIIFAVSPVFSPIAGYLSDRFGVGLVQCIATLMNSISFFLLMVEGLRIQVAGMVFYSLGRMMVFAMFYSNIGTRFGYDGIGTLVGVGYLASALLSLVQYPMLDAASSGFDTTINLVCGIVFIGLMPYCIMLGSKEIFERKKSCKGETKSDTNLEDILCIEKGITSTDEEEDYSEDEEVEEC